VKTSSKNGGDSEPSYRKGGRTAWKTSDQRSDEVLQNSEGTPDGGGGVGILVPNKEKNKQVERNRSRPTSRRKLRGHDFPSFDKKASLGESPREGKILPRQVETG